MPLRLDIEYHHTSGLYEATLPNGARFTFSRSDVGGKLENNLDLYRRGVIAYLSGAEPPAKSKAEVRAEAEALSAGKPVQVVGKKKYTKLRLDDLDIDIDV